MAYNIDSKENHQYQLNQKVLFDIIKRFNGKNVYIITNKGKSVGILSSIVFIINSNEAEIKTDLFMTDSDNILTFTINHKINPDEQDWKKNINNSIIDLFINVKQDLLDKFNIEFPSDKIYFEDIEDSFEMSGYKFIQIFNSNYNGIINDIDFRSLAKIYDIDIINKSDYTL